MIAVSNEGRDPVMQRKRLLGIARAYLADGSIQATDPLVSPILGSSPSLLGLPATLVQVGAAEVLLDESLELQKLAKDVRAPATEAVLAKDVAWPLMMSAHDVNRVCHLLCAAGWCGRRRAELRRGAARVAHFLPPHAARCHSAGAGGCLPLQALGVAISRDGGLERRGSSLAPALAVAIVVGVHGER